MAARQYHVKLNGTGFTVEPSSYQEATQEALSIKTSQGDAKYSDMSHLSNYIQSDWRGGRGENMAESGNQFWDSSGVQTWVKNRVALMPRKTLIGAQAEGMVMPGDHNFDAGDSISGSGANPITKLAQSFQFTQNTAVTRCCLYLRDYAEPLESCRSRIYRLRIETHDAINDCPTGTLANANCVSTLTIVLDTMPQWCRFTFTGSATLTGGTRYWLVLSCDTTLLSTENVQWLTSPSSVYAGQNCLYYSGGWAATADTDNYFAFDEPTDLPAAPTLGIVFNNIFYLAAGTGLYKITGGVWVGVKADFATAITDMDVDDAVLWISTGKGTTCWTMTTGESFTEKTGIFGQQLYFFGGYLYRANGNSLYYTSDGTTWSDAVTIGTNDYDINGMTGYRNSVMIAKPDGLFAFTEGLWAECIKRWESELDSNNGKGICVFQGEVYCPVKYGLVKYDGSKFVGIGPDQDEGLPAGRIGRIVSMVPLLNYLIVAVDATAATDYGSVLLYNGYGWHEVGRSWWAGARVSMVAFDWYASPNRLYYGMGQHVAYVEFSDKADDVAVWAPADYETMGWLETGWITGGLNEIAKSLRGIRYAAVAGTNTWIYIDYKTDDIDIWHPTAFLAASYPEWAPTVATDIDTTLAQAIGIANTAVYPVSMTSLHTGDWIRIGAEHRQITAVNAGSSFVSVLPVVQNNWSAGETVKNGLPSFRRLKLRIRLTSSAGNASSAILKFARAVYTNILTPWKRWSFAIRAEDAMQLLDGTEDTRSGQTIQDSVMDLAAQTNQAMSFSDIYEVEHTAQLESVSCQLVSAEWDDDVEGMGCEWLIRVNLVEV